MNDDKDKNVDQVLSHNYDGIQEYDNDLPRWWLMLFWIGIFFGFIYVAYFHFGSGTFTSQELAKNMQEISSKQKETQKKEASSVSEESLLAFSQVEKNVENGNTLYQAKCMPCHGADGGGLIGPNLTDNYWIHGGSLMDIRKIILEGVVEKGMISWKTQLTPNEVKELVAFIHSLRGTDPANPKEKQGDLYKYPNS